MRVRIKICGITRLADAEAAVAAGADAIGLVFYPASPRDMSQELSRAAEIARSVGPFVTVVGLFVNPDPSELEAILAQVPIHLLQFHGDETPEFCEQFCRPYLKAVRMKQDVVLDNVIKSYGSASGILLDTYKKGVPGGTGESFNWERVPLNSGKPIILAGGLNPENASVAVSVTEPYGLDVSGGVEESPGIKSSNKIKAFVESAQSGVLSE